MVLTTRQGMMKMLVIEPKVRTKRRWNWKDVTRMLMKLSDHVPMLTFLILSRRRSMLDFLILIKQTLMSNFLSLAIKLRIESMTFLTLCMENLLQRQLQ